jgi:hypothetical protein
MSPSLALSLCCLLAGPGDGDQFRTETRAIVRLTDGRIVRGNIDRRSTEHELWLVNEAPGVRLVSVFPAYHVERFLELHDGPPDSPGPAAFDLEHGPEAILPSRFEPPRPAGRPVSLRIFARLDNWDSDLEPDGVRLAIVPVDAADYLVPVSGTIDAQLWAIGRDRPGTVRLAEWSRVIHAEDFGPDGAEYRLPFRRTPPELTRPLIPEGLIHVRLGVSGVGVLSASREVILQHPSRFRDRLEHQTGRRRLPIER